MDRRSVGAVVAAALIAGAALTLTPDAARSRLASSRAGSWVSASEASNGPPELDGGSFSDPASPMGLQGDLVAAFYYQGFLTEDNAPVDGTRAMEFQLWSTDKIPEQVGVTLDRTVQVHDGQFNLSLGWGSNEINGRGLQLQVRVQDANGTWQTLPRKPILAVPYAMSLKPGAKVIGETGATTLAIVSKGGDGLSSTGDDDGVLGMTTSLDEAAAGVKGQSSVARSKAKGGSFTSVSGVGLYGASLGDNGVVGKGCSLPDCYGGHFTGDSGIYAEANDDTPYSHAGSFVGDVVVTEGLSVDGPVVLSGDIWGLTVKDRARFNSATVTGTLRTNGLVVEGPAFGSFPRPTWDSRWVRIGRGDTETLTHDLGGDPSDYFADFQCRDTASSGLGIHVLGHGGMSVTKPLLPDDSRGAYYRNLTSTNVRVYRLGDDDYCDEVRVRLWVIN